MRKRLLAFAAMLALTLGVAATPAHAAQSDCPAVGYLCVWNEANWGGSPDYYWAISSAGTGGYCINYGGSLNDNVDSLKITGNTALSVTQYQDANCSGSTVSFNRPAYYGGPSAGACASLGFEAWACFWDGAGSYRPSSAWVIKS